MSTAQSQRITSFFKELRRETIDLVDQFYSQDALFIDPIGTHRGLASIKKYYSGLYQNVSSISFDFSSVMENGEHYAAVWTMHLSAKNLNRGKPISVPGVSHIQFSSDGSKVVYHRDYFDMGCFIYEHIPVLSALIRFIKSKLAA